MARAKGLGLNPQTSCQIQFEGLFCRVQYSKVQFGIESACQERSLVKECNQQWTDVFTENMALMVTYMWFWSASEL